MSTTRSISPRSPKNRSLFSNLFTKRPRRRQCRIVWQRRHRAQAVWARVPRCCRSPCPALSLSHYSTSSSSSSSSVDESIDGRPNSGPLLHRSRSARGRARACVCVSLSLSQSGSCSLLDVSTAGLSSVVGRLLLRDPGRVRRAASLGRGCARARACVVCVRRGSGGPCLYWWSCFSAFSHAARSGRPLHLSSLSDPKLDPKSLERTRSTGLTTLRPSYPLKKSCQIGRPPGDFSLARGKLSREGRNTIRFDSNTTHTKARGPTFLAFLAFSTAESAIFLLRGDRSSIDRFGKCAARKRERERGEDDTLRPPPPGPARPAPNFTPRPSAPRRPR